MDILSSPIMEMEIQLSQGLEFRQMCFLDRCEGAEGANR